ncbi:MAG: hypothetical protein IKL92_07500, partial [Oscillospiraceae bacterium]|nr:hypothetical protein [Oscillospiraceae bacterium]
LKSIKLTTMEPENPATGGGLDVYIVTEDDQLTFSYNGNWFTVSQLGQDKWWIFDGKSASEQFGKMSSEVWDIIHGNISQTTDANIPLDSSPEWIGMMNESLNENLLKLEGMRGEILYRINEKILSHREGTFTEMPNHHEPWPSDFPPPDGLEYPLTEEDFAIVPTFYERIDDNSCVEGEINIWVKLSDQGHYMVLKPAWFGVMGTNEPVLGISDSGFYSGELKFDFDSHSKRTPDT